MATFFAEVDFHASVESGSIDNDPTYVKIAKDGAAIYRGVARFDISSLPVGASLSPTLTLNLWISKRYRQKVRTGAFALDGQADPELETVAQDLFDGCEVTGANEVFFPFKAWDSEETPVFLFLNAAAPAMIEAARAVGTIFSIAWRVDVETDPPIQEFALLDMVSNPPTLNGSYTLDPVTLVVDDVLMTMSADATTVSPKLIVESCLISASIDALSLVPSLSVDDVIHAMTVENVFFYVRDPKKPHKIFEIEGDEVMNIDESETVFDVIPVPNA